MTKSTSRATSKRDVRTEPVASAASGTEAGRRAQRPKKPKPDHIAADAQHCAPGRCECGAELPHLDIPFASGTFTFQPRLCPACAEADLERERRETHDRRIAHLLDRAGGGRMRHLSLATYPADNHGSQALATVHTWLDADPRPNLLLYGTVGAGKTGLAWGLIRHLCEHGTEAMLVNLRDWLAKRRYAISTHEPPDLRPLHVPILALDDVGAERPTDWARDELAQLVEERYQHQRPTIVTSNYDPAELAKRLGHDDLVIGQRIVSRLCDGAVQVRFTGTDRRIAA